MSNHSIKHNDVYGAGTLCEGPSSGRCSTVQQGRPGRYHVTARTHGGPGETFSVCGSKSEIDDFVSSFDLDCEEWFLGFDENGEDLYLRDCRVVLEDCMSHVPVQASETVKQALKCKPVKLGRGKNKVAWSKDERRVLWECFVRSGGARHGGYMNSVKRLWDERGLTVRDTPSLISQLKQIENNGLLTESERREIRRMVEEDRIEEWELEEGWCEENGNAPFQEYSDGEAAEVDFVVDAALPNVAVGQEGDGIARELTREEGLVLQKMREIFVGDSWEDVPSLKAIDRRRVDREVMLVNGLMPNLIQGDPSVSDINRLLYTGSYVVADRLGLVGKAKKKAGNWKPWWQRRLERSIGEWRKDLSRVEGIRQGKDVSRKVSERLNRKYDLLEKGALWVSTLLKNKINSGSTKIRSFVGKRVAYRQNNLFKNNQSQLYKELGSGSSTGKHPVPNANEAREFWSGIWSAEKQHNSDAAWLNGVKESFGGVEEQAPVEVALEDVVKGIRKMANWKAPGPDGVRGFWFKKFPSLHSTLTAALQKCLESGHVPDWMVKGRTVLIQKDPAKGSVASNYRPITCLPLMWKLLTGIFADKIYDHLMDNNLLPDEQKGCRKRSRGTKDQLLIDKAILREARAKKRCLAMAWIDYRKAYDMVPHSWILEMLKMLKVAGNVERLLAGSMGGWKTVLTANGESLGEVDINRGIFQGDSLSPLLFIAVMIPLSTLLKREMKGYQFGQDGQLINHLLFMDDLKLYGRTEAELEGLVKVVGEYSQDIGMEFGLDKCGVLVIRNGVKERHEGIMLPDGELMKEIDESGYKYLGVLEGASIMDREMKEKVGKEYLRRVKLVAKSKLYAGNLVRGINAWAVSVVRYSAGVLDWTDKELKALDVRTRKLLTMFGVFHMRSSVDRLYMKRVNGGRGLISVLESVRAEEKGLFGYVAASEEWMLKVVAGTLRIDESKKEYLERVRKERDSRFAGKKLHGKFFGDISKVGDKEKSWQWVRAGYMAKSTEAFLFAAQEQALRTRLVRANIDGEEIDPLCRLCGKVGETTGHLASGCSKLAQREYKRRHDRMGLRVYWELCKKYGMKYSSRWYEEVPEAVRLSKDGNFELWWDRSVETTQKLDHNRPDIVLINRVKKEWLIVDFSVPSDVNVVGKEDEKIMRYSPLALDARKLHGVSTKVIPVVVGSFGVVSSRLAGFLRELGVGHTLGGLQTSAIIGTSIILKKVLCL